MSAIQSSNINYLKCSAYLFSQEKNVIGKRVFTLVCTGDRQDEIGVYFFMWRNKGSPLGISDYGKWCFHDQHGITSTSQEKANAIYSYLLDHHQNPFFIPPPSLHAFFHSLDRPVLERPSIEPEILSDVSSDEPDYAYYILIGTGVISAATLALSLLSGRGGERRDLPSLAGHVTVGSGHFPFPEAVQRLTHVSSSLSSRMQIDPPAPRRASQERQIILIEANEGNDRHQTPSERNTGYHYRGTVDRHQNGYQGSIEQEQFEAGLRSLQERIESLSQELGQTRVQEIQRQIQEWRDRLETIQQQSGDKLLDIVKKFAWMLVPKGPLQWTDIFPLMEVFEDFKEFGDIGSAAKEVKAELGRLLEMERSLERANEVNRLNELRAQ